MRNAVERSAGRSRSRKPYPGIVSTVGSIRFSDSEPVRWLPSSRGNPSFGNGRQQRRKRYETVIDCHTKSASYSLRTMLGSRVPRLRLPEAETTRNSRSCPKKCFVTNNYMCRGRFRGIQLASQTRAKESRFDTVPGGRRLQAASDSIDFANARPGVLLRGNLNSVLSSTSGTSFQLRLYLYGLPDFQTVCPVTVLRECDHVLFPHKDFGFASRVFQSIE